jgi:glutamyl/glutaminyl-tRNA synthetase
MKVPFMVGKYGPYRQTERREIYQHYAKDSVERVMPTRVSARRAIGKMRKEQEARKVDRVKYDGTCRRLDPDDAARRIAAVKNM